MLRVRQISEMRTVVVGELVFTDHMRDFYACDGGCGGMECFEAHHWFGDPFDEPMVLFKDINDASFYHLKNIAPLPLLNLLFSYPIYL